MDERCGLCYTVVPCSAAHCSSLCRIVHVQCTVVHVSITLTDILSYTICRQNTEAKYVRPQPRSFIPISRGHLRGMIRLSFHQSCSHHSVFFIFPRLIMKSETSPVSLLRDISCALVTE